MEKGSKSVWSLTLITPLSPPPSHPRLARVCVCLAICLYVLLQLLFNILICMYACIYNAFVCWCVLLTQVYRRYLHCLPSSGYKTLTALIPLTRHPRTPACVGFPFDILTRFSTGVSCPLGPGIKRLFRFPFSSSCSSNLSPFCFRHVLHFDHLPLLVIRYVIHFCLGSGREQTY